MHPALRQNVAHRVRKCFEAFACARYFWVDRTIKDQVSFINGGFGPGKSNQVAAVLLEELSASLCAFLDDLAASRLDDRVLVLVFSEFGRRVAENGSMGTDHGTAGPVFLAGPCVRPGLNGAYPSLSDLDDGDLKMAVDFRRVYATVLEGWLGLRSKAALGGIFEPLPLLHG